MYVGRCVPTQMGTCGGQRLFDIFLYCSPLYLRHNLTELNLRLAVPSRLAVQGPPGSPFSDSPDWGCGNTLMHFAFTWAPAI